MRTCRTLVSIFQRPMNGHEYFGQRRSRLFVNEDGYPHPTGVAASNTAWYLDGKEFTEAIPLAEEKGTAYVFRSGKETTVVLMPRWSSEMAVPPARSEDIRIVDLFGNSAAQPTTENTLFVSGDPDSVKAFIGELSGNQNSEEERASE